jgi:polyisoprenyl-phosphate glycosyltransferase
VNTAEDSSRILIVIPVFDDWANINILIPRIGAVLKNICGSYRILIIDDGTPSHKIGMDAMTMASQPGQVKIVRLLRNMGHQRAIAVGLSYAANNETFSKLIVMDSDGEDRPEDIQKLVVEYSAQSGKIIFASRKKRNETIVFKLFYGLYKILFRLLTGIPISFGNFSLIPSGHLKQLVCMPELWNHFAAGVIRAKIPTILLPLERGKRQSGKSKMNFQSLIVHGLSAISVFIDTMAVRLLIVSLLLILISVVAILIVFGIKLFTTLAIPGWASFIVLGFLSILLQAVTLFFVQAFLVLSFRSQKSVIPYYDYKLFIDSVTEI